MNYLKNAIAGLVLGATALSSASALAANGYVGIAMPTKSSARWITDGDSMVKLFQDAGYKVDLQYAEDEIPNQLSQIENMIVKGVDVLVIAAIDGTTLSNALENADAAGIKVISYDRLIKNSPYVSYMEKRGKGPYNVELFGGSPDDNNAYFFYNGAMSVLQPMIDSGKVNVVSGQMGMDTVGTLRWDGATAQARMDNLLSAHYTKKRVDGVLSPYDGISIGILSSLKGVGYGSGNLKMPIVTGQDAEVQSVKSIISGEQYSTIFKDTRELANVTVGMVQAVLNDTTPEINDTKTYDNGIKVIPSYLLEPVTVDKSNWQDVLLGSGYYTKSQIE